MTVPIRNIYRMLVYAWDALECADERGVSEEDETDLLDLLAAVLCHGTEYLLRRGLDRSYVEIVESIPGIRGRAEFTASMATLSFQQGRAVCRFDELRYDVLHNRILRHTLRELARMRGPATETRHRCADLSRRLRDVGDIALRSHHFREVQLHRNNRHYGLLMDVCRLIHECTLVDESTGEIRFRDFTRNDAEMRRLFERFVRAFYRHELKLWRVTAPSFPWQSTTASASALDALQYLFTDEALRRDGLTILIETKFVESVLSDTRYSERKVSRDHLFQLYAYLQNVSRLYEGDGTVGGLLLYPAVNESIALDYVIHDFPVRVATVDLGQSWPDAKSELLDHVAALELAMTARPGESRGVAIS